jgi:hypothetical protein
VVLVSVIQEAEEATDAPGQKASTIIMPQAVAAMSTKFLMPRILDRVGYRGVLISNTMVFGLLLMLFATIGPGTSLWAIVLQAF